MSEYTQQDRTLALIGIYQASQLVFDLATTGKVDELAYNTCIQSLFCDNPENTLEVYGSDVKNIQVGLNTLLAQMSSEEAVQMRNVEVTRYVLSLIILQKKLQQLGEPLNNIASILETAKGQQTHFGQNHENVIAAIARAYSENVSNINPRVMVNGQHGHLDNPRVANKIRALLLAGIRSALLWSQLGGTRWGLLWSRKKYLQSALELQAMLPVQKEKLTPPTSIFKDD
ncbi:MAG: high frequency lysogenization protein HflD [Gammaproteobacteria bacterium]|nr:high frequency lysogenization protein HflD [Gammaproteobacteria bacterium]